MLKAIYGAGLAALVGGLGYGAVLLQVSYEAVAVGAITLPGIAVRAGLISPRGNGLAG